MRSLHDLASGLAACTVATLLAIGCTPASQYRYTGMVPAARPVPFDGRTAEKGTGRIEGTLTTQIVRENEVPALHDSALHVPEVTVDGAGTYALNDHVELGLRFSYARYASTQQTAAGTAPLPGEPSLLGLGPEMRSTITLDPEDKWAIGIAWNLMRYALPTAAWAKTPSCTPGPKCFADPLTPGASPTYYAFKESSSQDAWVLSLSLLLSHAFGEHGEYGHVFGGFAFHPTFGNDGFTDSTSSSSEIKSKGWTPIATAGYGVRLKPVRVGASLFLPMGGDDESIMWGLGGQLTLGVELGGPSRAPAQGVAAKSAAIF